MANDTKKKKCAVNLEERIETLEGRIMTNTNIKRLEERIKILKVVEANVIDIENEMKELGNKIKTLEGDFKILDSNKTNIQYLLRNLDSNDISTRNSLGELSNKIKMLELKFKNPETEKKKCKKVEAKKKECKEGKNV